MNIIENILSGEWVYALGWTVLHSLWQATLIALIIGVILLKMQKQAASRRYWVANVGWFSILICAIITFISYYQPSESLANITTTRLIAEGEVSLSSSPSLFGPYFQILGNYFNAHLPLIVSLWALGVCVFLLRFLGGLIFLQHLRSHRVQSLPASWQAKLLAIQHQIGLNKSVQLLESALVKVPMVIGWFKPLILLPIGTLNSLSTQQVEAILAHELAHIKRHDYLLNLVRSLVEVLFYFNPAVWWLSAQIRTEREHCCDDIALEVCGNSLAYVRALVALQELSQKPMGGLAMTLVGSKPELLNRVRRILNQPKDKSNIMEKLVITCLLLIGLSFTLISAGLPDEKQIEAVVEISDVPVLDKVITTQKRTYVVSFEDVDQDTDGDLIVEMHEDPIIEIITRDTLPKGTTHLQMTKDGKRYNVKIRNSEIQRLSIDGQLIPEQDLVNYYDLVQNLIDEVPEPPEPPLAPVAPPALPAPTAVPAPPAPPTPPAPSIRGMDSAPGVPPTPPSPPAPMAAPAPPAPPAPPVPRIKLRKPKGEHEQNRHSFHFELSDEGDLDEKIISSVARNGTSDPTSIWVSADPEVHAANVVVVELHEEHGNFDLEDQKGVLIEVISKSPSEGNEFVFSDTPVVEGYHVEGRKTAVFYSHSDQLNGMSKQQDWRHQIEANLLKDQLLPNTGDYKVQFSKGQLLIDGAVQAQEVYDKYFNLLQNSMNEPLQESEFYFFNRKTRSHRIEQ